MLQEKLEKLKNLTVSEVTVNLKEVFIEIKTTCNLKLRIGWLGTDISWLEMQKCEKLEALKNTKITSVEVFFDQGDGETTTKIVFNETSGVTFWGTSNGYFNEEPNSEWTN